MLNEFVFSATCHSFQQPVLGGIVSRPLVGTGRRSSTSPRCRLAVRVRLNEVFGENRVIALHHNVEWPPRSPDLTPCDFFMWGYLKNKVFATPPQNINVLRQRIIDEFNVLRQQPEMIRNAVRDMHKRTILCVERNGGHVEGHGP